jgi:MFS family permease
VQQTTYRRQTWILTIGIGLVMMGVTLVAPILPLYAREFGVGYTAAGALITGFAVARLSFSLLGGVAGDRWGARRVTVFGALLLTVASVTAATAPNYGVLLGSRFVEGIGSALYATAAMQYLVQITPKPALGRMTARFQTGLLTGVTVGPVLGGGLAQVGNLRTPFWVYAFLGLIVAGFAARFVESLPPSGRSIGATFKAAGMLLRKPAFAVLMFVGFALFVMRAGALVTLIPLYAGEVVGLAPLQIGAIFSVGALVTLVLVNVSGRLVDRIGRKPVGVVGLALIAIAVAAYGFVSSFPGFLTVAFFYGIASGFASTPPPTMVGDMAPVGSEGSAVGLFRMAGDLGAVVGPITLGAIADTGAFRTGFLVTAVLLLVSAILLSRVPETRRVQPVPNVEPL